MMAILVAVLTASTTFAAVFPFMKAQGPRVAQLMRKSAAIELGVSKACRKIEIIKRPPRGTVVQGCSSARKRPCPRRRW
jgi:hypothetical protein